MSTLEGPGGEGLTVELGLHAGAGLRGSNKPWSAREEGSSLFERPTDERVDVHLASIARTLHHFAPLRWQGWGRPSQGPHFLPYLAQEGSSCGKR